MLVAEVMHACTIVAASQTVSEVAGIMEEHLTSSALVKKDELVKGIVTERDILRKVVAKGINPDTTRVSDIMSSPLITIGEHASLYEASEMMDKHGIRRLVVTNGEQIVGIINTAIVSKNLRYITAREKLFIRPEYPLTEVNFF